MLEFSHDMISLSVRAGTGPLAGIPWAGTGPMAGIPWAGAGPLAGIPYPCIPYPCIPYTRLRGADPRG